jgi:hypothetical protein
LAPSSDPTCQFSRALSSFYNHGQRPILSPRGEVQNSLFAPPSFLTVKCSPLWWTKGWTSPLGDKFHPWKQTLLVKNWPQGDQNWWFFAYILGGCLRGAVLYK